MPKKHTSREAPDRSVRITPPPSSRTARIAGDSMGTRGGEVIPGTNAFDKIPAAPPAPRARRAAAPPTPTAPPAAVAGDLPMPDSPVPGTSDIPNPNPPAPPTPPVVPPPAPPGPDEAAEREQTRRNAELQQLRQQNQQLLARLEALEQNRPPAQNGQQPPAAGTTPPAPPATPPAATPPGKAPAPAPRLIPEAQEEVYAKKFLEAGELAPEDYAEMSAKGLSRQQVDRFLRAGLDDARRYNEGLRPLGVQNHATAIELMRSAHLNAPAEYPQLYADFKSEDPDRMLAAVKRALQINDHANGRPVQQLQHGGAVSQGSYAASGPLDAKQFRQALNAAARVGGEAGAAMRKEAIANYYNRGVKVG